MDEMNVLEERLVQEYTGKELREFLISECGEKIGNREVWVCIDNTFNTLFFNRDFLTLFHLGSRVKDSLIIDIRCDDDDLTICIENPFKGVD